MAMGLDLLDIMFRIEKEFGISLSPEDFESIARDQDIRVGDLYDVGYSRKVAAQDRGQVRSGRRSEKAEHRRSS
jgi:hypothetical protein